MNWVETGDAPTNIAGHYRTKRGDVEAGFAQADVVVERTFHHPDRPPGLYRTQHGHRASGATMAVCRSGAAPRAAIRPANRWPAILHLPLSRSASRPRRSAADLAARTTFIWNRWPRCSRKKSGSRPVKMMMTRAEVLCRHGTGRRLYHQGQDGRGSPRSSSRRPRPTWPTTPAAFPAAGSAAAAA